MRVGLWAAWMVSAKAVYLVDEMGLMTVAWSVVLLVELKASSTALHSVDLMAAETGVSMVVQMVEW